MISGLVSAVFFLQIVMNIYYQLKLKLNMPKFFMNALFKFTFVFVTCVVWDLFGVCYNFRVDSLFRCFKFRNANLY